MIVWWRWAAATFVIAAMWLVLAPVFGGIASALVPSEPAWGQLFVDLSTFIPFFLATPLAWLFLLGRPLGLLLNVHGRAVPRRIGIGFVVWLALCAIGTGFDALLNPGDYTYTFSAGAFLPFLLVTIVLLPVQTSAEELFFRGWILRWAHSLPVASQVFISGIVFAWPHLGNPEAASDTALALTAYFLLGAGWAYVSVRSGGIELALGAHLANNAFSLLIVGYDDAALPTSAIFTTNSLNLATTALTLAVMAPVFAIVTTRVRGKSS